jgi:hypothetical protein
MKCLQIGISSRLLMQHAGNTAGTHLVSATHSGVSRRLLTRSFEVWCPTPTQLHDLQATAADDRPDFAA